MEATYPAKKEWNGHYAFITSIVIHIPKVVQFCLLFTIWVMRIHAQSRRLIQERNAIVWHVVFAALEKRQKTAFGIKSWQEYRSAISNSQKYVGECQLFQRSTAVSNSKKHAKSALDKLLLISDLHCAKRLECLIMCEQSCIALHTLDIVAQECNNLVWESSIPFSGTTFCTKTTDAWRDFHCECKLHTYSF